MNGDTYDLIVLGGGPGGYVAAIRASQLGQRVALVEHDAVGGVCLNWGCVPTKALLRNAEVANLLSRGDEFGFKLENLQLDYSVAQKRSRQVSERLVRGVGFLIKKNLITLVRGTATMIAANGLHRVEVAPSGQVLEAVKLIIATGARPRSFPGLEIDGRQVINYRQALELTTAPPRLVVVGAGAIGMEFAYVFRSYGSEVTVVEMLPHLLPAEDEETAAEVARAFKKQGIKALANTRTESLERADQGVIVRLRDQNLGRELSVAADIVLVAVGVAPNSDGIGLEAAGVSRDGRGFISVNEYMQTNVPGVYAIGDVTGRLMLAHVASAQGVVAAEHQAGHAACPLQDDDYTFMPRATYCQPQVASMGYTETQARGRGREIKVGKFPFQANAKALGLGERDGFVKVIVDAGSGEILGAHMVGSDVTELLPELQLARAGLLTAEAIARATHAHPTLSEAVKEAIEGALGRAIHL